MIYTHVAAAILAAAVAATGAWKVQDWRYDAKEKERVEQQLEDQRIQAKTRLRQEERVVQAQNAATTRAIGLARDAAGTRSALISLSDATNTALRDAAISHNACTVRANTLGELFKESSGRYEELAEKAGRHISDIQTLTQAWPQLDSETK